jgi:(2R)-sulfolactate sulfo-lyase subunit alpha
VAQSTAALAERELSFLVHEGGDDVAVAVRDTEPGTARGAYLKSSAPFEIKVCAPIPLGHKVALREINENEHVIEYGVAIGIARHSIAQGDHVHTHNLRSARWQNSL